MGIGISKRVWSLIACLALLAMSLNAEERALLTHYPAIVTAEQGGPLITVLCYHHVDCAVKTEYSVTSAQLSEQIDALKAAGFSFIDSRALEDFYVQGKPIPVKSALITFDDGNYDVFRSGYPLLKKRGIPFTFFVYPKAVNEGHAKHGVDWADLRVMADNGVTIGSHTMSHPFLTKPPETVTTREEYDVWLENEIAKSRAEIETQLKRPVTEIAIPFGAFDAYIRQKAIEAGYTMAFNVNGVNSDVRADRWNMNRIIVKASMSIKQFLELATAPPLVFSSTQPSALARIHSETTDVTFILDDAEAYDESTVQSHVSSFEGLELQHIKDTDFYVETVDLRRPAFYEVYVSAKDRVGRLCRGAWLFIYEKDSPTSIFP